MLRDRFGRNISYLRLSLTDACNLRCQYCMDEDAVFMKKHRLISNDELERVVRLMFDLGIEKIRISGGEPLLRKDIFPRLLEIKKKFTQKKWGMTTNLASENLNIEILSELFDEVNVSLDSLSPEVFHQITRRDKLHIVLANIKLLKDKGVKIKLNTVVIPDVNDHQIFEMIDWSGKQGIPIRFIEQMPFNSEGKAHFISSKELLARIAKTQSFSRQYEIPSATAEYFKMDDSEAIFGVISAYSRNFCSSCNRLRLAANGDLTTCLYGKPGMNVLRLLRDNFTDQKVKEALCLAVFNKEKNGFVAEEKNDNLQLMNVLGG